MIYFLMQFNPGEQFPTSKILCVVKSLVITGYVWACKVFAVFIILYFKDKK